MLVQFTVDGNVNENNNKSLALLRCTTNLYMNGYDIRLVFIKLYLWHNCFSCCQRLLLAKKYKTFIPLILHFNNMRSLQLNLV